MTKNDKGRWSKATYTIVEDGGETRSIAVCGRTRWALELLMTAREKGCTPIDTPGPRWSDYVFKLRGAGLEIETISEKHDGPFAGTHARYVLRSTVSPAHIREVAA